MEINSSLGTSSPLVPSRLESSTARRSSSVRRPSVRLQSPGDTRKQPESALSQSKSRKSSVSNTPLGKPSPSRWKGLQKQLPTWMAETKSAENNQTASAGVNSLASTFAATLQPFTDAKDSRGPFTPGRSASLLAPTLAEDRKRSGSMRSTVPESNSTGDNGMRLGSVRSSSAGVQGSQTLSANSTVKAEPVAGGALAQRFADVVRQATKPAWLSANISVPTRSAPGMGSAPQASVTQPATSAAQGAAQDLVAMINATLPSPPAAAQGIPSPGTPVKQERGSSLVDSARNSPRVQSRLAAGSSGPGSAELAEIEALLSPQVNMRGSSSKLLQGAAFPDSSLSDDRRRPQPTADSYPRSSNADSASQPGTPASQAQGRMHFSGMHQDNGAIAESRMMAEAYQEHARRVLADGGRNQGFAEPLTAHLPPGQQPTGPANRGEPLIGAAVLKTSDHLTQNKLAFKWLKSSSIEPATLTSLRTKWLQNPGIPTSLLSPPGLRYDLSCPVSLPQACL